jgi:ABC-type phosphate/phosphonate transport system substrate-binding protein
MPDAFKECDDERDVRGVLGRISDALGVPVAAFFGSNADMSESLRHQREEQVLGIVRAYLRQVDREAARRFVTAVQALVETDVR